MIKVVTILGARPQFIKAGSVSREITLHNDVREVIVHTGQHYDANMSDVFFEEMKIPKPDYFLGIGGSSHGAMTGQMIEKIEEVLLKEKPDWVLVYGDTNSTLAGALAASKLHIKVAHIEAGLRSFNMKMPEEINRILTDRISSILFCPTQTAIDNLENEGVDKWQTQVKLSGDVMQDGALFYKELAEKPSDLELSGEFVLSTIHRAENTDDEVRLTAIIEAINEVAQTCPVVLPIHPRTKAKLENLTVKLSVNVKVITPVGYLNMVWLIDNCKLIMTDSGGLQKEAFFFEKPCITLRDETEWVELIEHNFNILVGANKQAIITAYNEHRFANDYNVDLYGNGMASESIVKALVNNDS
ncbi:UDP-N-acetylglucosamine 2-epimerase (non-hydrolyzing) [Colwellia sp. E2M01]|uniref:non-hydrolyzing UDP-N-acetylglucosamine 2-epimerase n=1 Tax=Colwellia sp. E2M01 TaxID=2841561 RepID=UPI001C0A645F|nr:UDP-N-acetylglucosamine 2-epimerase (non-hydrolyzing) [Colwellia sp. E2M01]MBU2869207.1 UDP-N-acetylglucosamine 2-epimerase (non-hydrolyzing) [Colwellia sp. E2M01]